nr:thiamine phosphate synthase [Coralloluteibacterium stylophorae]
MLTPDEADTTRLLARVAEVLHPDRVALLQYRNKPALPTLRVEQALALRALSRERGVPFIINDDVALAASVGADGVHLGADDGDLTAARQRLGADAIVGASCYGDLDRAACASAAGADYLAFGAFHASATKPAARRADHALVAAAARFRLPRVAIGGIDAQNAAATAASGAEFLAVIGGVFGAADPPRAAAAIAAAIAAARADRAIPDFDKDPR